MALKAPSFIPQPWATSGQAATIPDQKPEFGRASWSQGFPTETSIPLNAGGIPPNYLDFQGVLKILSQFAFFQQSGGLFTWSSSLDYLKGCHILGSDGEEYVALASSGPSVSAGAKNPVDPSNSAYWKLANADIAALDAERLKQIGQIQTFAATALPEGWMICDGSSVLFADWPEFQQVYNEGRFTGMTVSTSTPAQVGKLVINGSSGVYLPDLEELFVQASAAGTAGAYVAPGLPNIRGTSGASDKIVDGAFYNGEAVITVGNAEGSGNVKHFSASQYNPIYSDSVDTVQPPAVKYIMAMYLGKPNSAAA